jgi:hypothetical protein
MDVVATAGVVEVNHHLTVWYRVKFESFPLGVFGFCHKSPKKTNLLQGSRAAVVVLFLKVESMHSGRPSRHSLWKDAGAQRKSRGILFNHRPCSKGRMFHLQRRLSL